ncbi:hypothetical protein [Paenibacillus rigui]|uniref:Uncharacterized protein n=1 Tax=Paenibacillus rigui TaxID=554312 RepID=A0A229USD9_9BACL|nr:hypothetical protein [Paenibacillus rigui]OXM86322.1 hypothetical protein CF651_10330 [Paenibacillus rigui]
MRICIDNKEIPVTFVSSDHKVIPQLIQTLRATQGSRERSGDFDMEALERIEVVGMEAHLYSSTQLRKCLALYA